MMNEPTSHSYQAEDGIRLAYHEFGVGRPLLLGRGYTSIVHAPGRGGGIPGCALASAAAISGSDIVLRYLVSKTSGGSAMFSPTLDPTAGERARAVRIHPDAVPPVTDPTDTRYGAVPYEPWELARPFGRVFDPTDPHCARRAD
jgi:hypothetical protein